MGNVFSEKHVMFVHLRSLSWQDAGWNVFDLCLVVLAVYDQAMFFVWRLGRKVAMTLHSVVFVQFQGA